MIALITKTALERLERSLRYNCSCPTPVERTWTINQILQIPKQASASFCIAFACCMLHAIIFLGCIMYSYTLRFCHAARTYAQSATPPASVLAHNRPSSLPASIIPVYSTTFVLSAYSVTAPHSFINTTLWVVYMSFKPVFTTAWIT